MQLFISCWNITVSSISWYHHQYSTSKYHWYNSLVHIVAGQFRSLNTRNGNLGRSLPGKLYVYALFHSFLWSEIQSISFGQNFVIHNQEFK